MAHGLRTTGTHTGNFGKARVKVKPGELDLTKKILSKENLRIPSRDESFTKLLQAYNATTDARLKADLWEILKRREATLQPIELMHVQHLPTGRTFVEYGDPMEYQSPILIDENYPSVVTYKCAKSMQLIGKVYKTADGRWWLATCFLQHWTPIEVFSKIEGFLLLNNIHKQHHV